MSEPTPTPDDNTNDHGIVAELEPLPVVPDQPVVPGEPGKTVTGTFDPTATAHTLAFSVKQEEIAPAEAGSVTAPQAEYPVDVYELVMVKETDAQTTEGTTARKYVPQLHPVSPERVAVGPAKQILEHAYQFTATINVAFDKTTTLVFIIPVDDKHVGYGSVVVNKAF